MNRKLDGLLKRMARVDIGDKNSLEAIDDMTEAAATLRAQRDRIDALKADRAFMVERIGRLSEVLQASIKPGDPPDILVVDGVAHTGPVVNAYHSTVKLLIKTLNELAALKETTHD